RSSCRRVSVWVAPAIIALSAVAYLLTAARSVLGGDNGEFAMLYGCGGVAHPTGYPLYVLYLRSLSWLPATSPAHGAALATALLGGATTAVLYLACRAFGASRGSAAVVIATHAFSAPMWIASTHAEVFALNALLGAAILLAAGTDRLTGASRAMTLAALAGLGLSNHVSIVLLAPIGIYGLVRGVREATARARTFGLCAVALVFALSPYVYVVLASRTPADRFVWGAASDFQGLLHHMLRVDYGTTTLALGAHRSDRLGQELLLVRSLVVGLLGLPLVAIASPLLDHARFDSSTRTRTLSLLASFALTGPIFVALFNLSISGLDRRIVERFHLLPQVVACVVIAPAIDRVLSRWFARTVVATALAIACGAGAAGLSLEDVRVHHLPDVERYVRDTLERAPPHAIVLGTGDHRFGAFNYARRALHLREDVLYIDAYLTLTSWYRAQVGREVGIELVAPQGGSMSTKALASQLMSTGRPLLLADVFTEAIPRAFPTYPIGTLYRVVGSPAEVPDPATLERMNREVFAHMHPSAVPPPADSWGADLWPAYARPWFALADAFREQGDQAHAQELDAIGRSFSVAPP
ncbi:MAG: DUF2723 domain-containing protein, partial [Myxococcales bacterium]